MAEKILFVDDEINVLNSYQRHLRRYYQLDVALGSEAGIRKIKTEGPFAVVISDFRMPKMDGIQFLTRVREMSPDTVRIMLTGYADIKTIISAVNEGNIFRFLTKPCSPQILTRAIEDGLRQFRLMTAERELLEKTLRGSVQVLSDILALVNPEAFGRSSRIKRLARNVALHMRMADIWKIETAAMLSQIGCVILSQEALQKIFTGQKLTPQEAELYARHPRVAADLLTHIPRLEEIRDIVACQNYKFQAEEGQDRVGEAIPIAARILKVVLDYDMLRTAGLKKEEAIRTLNSKKGWYDPNVLKAFQEAIQSDLNYEIVKVRLNQLREGMILAEDVRAVSGPLLVSNGQEINLALIERLNNFAKFNTIKEPISVLIPVKSKEKVEVA